MGTRLAVVPRDVKARTEALELGGAQKVDPQEGCQNSDQVSDPRAVTVVPEGAWAGWAWLEQ